MPVFIHRSPLLTLALVAVVAWAAMLHGGVRGQVPAPAPAPGPSAAPAPGPSGLDCTNYYYNLTGCLSYVVVGSNVTAPGEECCPAVAGLLESNPICLCQLLAGGAQSFNVTIDNNRALKLPSACHLQAPPVSLCSDVGIPVASPMAPSPSPSGSIEHSPVSAPPQATPNLAAALGAVDLAAAAGASFIVGVLAIF